MWEQGIIATDDGVVIAKPGMRPDELRAEKLPFRKPAGLTGPGYERIDLGPVVINGNRVFIDIIFRRGRVKSLGLELSSAAATRMFEAGNSAAQKVKFYEAWVRKETGRSATAHFQWGEIGASVDHWSGDPYIYVKYI